MYTYISYVYMKVISFSLSLYIYIHTYICYVYMKVISFSVSLSLYMYIYIYIPMCACIYIYIYIHMDTTSSRPSLPEAGLPRAPLAGPLF